jgi:predicted enzyme related to lactoylglutathione lyase
VTEARAAPGSAFPGGGSARTVAGVTVRWLTAFLDRPASAFDASVGFWKAVTDTTLSAARGERDELATLVPADGDAYLRVQRVDDTPGGSHIDLHVDDIDALAGRAVDAGAEEVRRLDDVVVLRSPAGLPWCAVGHHGEAVVPSPQAIGGAGPPSRVAELCIDIPAERFDDECAFWEAVTGWELRDTTYPEFLELAGPERLALGLLLQRRDDSDGPARAHPDIAAGDGAAELVAHHVRLGATVTRAHPRWTAMRDPAGLPYCVTAEGIPD